MEKSILDYFKAKRGLCGVRPECKQCSKAYSLAFKAANPEKVRAWGNKKKRSRPASYRENEKLRRSTLEYKMYHKAYLLSKKEHIAKRQREYIRRNPVQHLRAVVSSNMYSHLKQNNLSKNRRGWENIVGYTVEDLKTHLDVMLLEKGWTWEGLGKVWEIDHKRPVSWFRFSSLEDPQIKECWALENLQPLLKADNRSKGNRWSDHAADQTSLPP